MKHYICTGGCKGVSKKPGVCQEEDCPKHEHQLKECDCADGKHYGAFKDTGIEGPGDDEGLEVGGDDEGLGGGSNREMIF